MLRTILTKSDDFNVVNFDSEYGKMAMNINKDATYKASKPREKDYKISGGGLALLVKENGVKCWEFFYRVGRFANLSMPNIPSMARFAG